MKIRNVLLLPFILFLSWTSAADDDWAPFRPSETLMADHAAALLEARQSGKRLMIIIGANWCHDTEAFLKKLDDKTVAPLVEANLHTLLVDVGYFDSSWQEILEHYDLPVIYGTPTPIIVDPERDEILNPLSMHDWRSADTEPVEDLREWVQTVTTPGFQESPSWLGEVKPWQQEALDRIDGFERSEAKRILAAFGSMGAVLGDPSVEPTSEERAEAMKKWKALLAMRASLAVRLPEARQAVMDGVPQDVEAIMKSLPRHELFDGF